MKTALQPIAGLIRRYGTHFHFRKAPPPHPAAPWKPEQQTASSKTVIGVIQQVQPVRDNDIPDGHTRSIAILMINKGDAVPRPGDHIQDDQNTWRIQTILPIGKSRGDTLVEAIMIGQGG
ncbi:hypothetical protein OAT37_00730 [Alphaproteobacteria bacterium]|jgi:hypothetical protein|nr:hypothetical protein [Alphaproteobacteria bacterium]